MMDPEQEGGSPSILTMSIASIVGMLVLIYVLWRVFFISSAFADVQACRDSVKMNSASAVRGEEMLKSIRCPMKEIEIKGDDLSEVELTLANELAECWYKFGEGREDLFGEIGDDDAVYCAICAKIDPVEKALNLRIDGFNDYLSDNRVPPKYLKTHKSSMLYVDFIQTYDSKTESYGDNKEYLQSIGRRFSSLTLSETFVTVYVHEKTGGSDWVASMELIPFRAANFKELKCKYMPVEQENFLKEEDRTSSEAISD